MCDVSYYEKCYGIGWLTETFSGDACERDGEGTLSRPVISEGYVIRPRLYNN